MGQRLGIAAALLGDPATVMLDEPVNGLDPEGVLWIRNLLKALAAEGRTVFVSSHLMSEMALTADHLIIIGRGRLLADTTVDDFVRDAGGGAVKVVTRRGRPAARAAGRRRTSTITSGAGRGAAGHRRSTAREIGPWPPHHGIAWSNSPRRTVSLEEAFMDLTRDAVEYHGAPPPTLERGEAA